MKQKDISQTQAQKALKVYKDADKIPAWALINAGKAEILKVTAHNPQTPNLFELKNDFKGGSCGKLYNMRKQALKRPNPNSLKQ